MPEKKALPMAILTFKPRNQRDLPEESAPPENRRKVVCIEEYRGAVMLRARRSPGTLTNGGWNGDPLPAA